MPQEPKTSTVAADTASGQYPIDFFTAEPSKGYVFVVTHNTYPPEVDMKDTEALFDKICKQLLSGDAHLLSSKPVSLHGISGRELEFEKRGQARVIQRIFLTDHEAFQVFCVMPKTAVCQQHAHQFVESFDLKQK